MDSGSIDTKVVAPVVAPEIKPPVVPEAKKPVLPEAKPSSKTHPLVEPQYKLAIYSSAGTVRPNLPAAFFNYVVAQHGDIMKAISSNRWMTLDEVCNEVWRIEKKMKHPANRTRKAVVVAVNEMIERGMVIVR